MTRGRKTKALTVTAGASFCTALIDPTGVSLITFLAAGTTAGVGGIYHGGRKSIKAIDHYRHNRRAKKADLHIDPKADMVLFVNLSTELEDCIRKLSCGSTGLTISGTMSVILPHLLIGVLLNGAQVAYEAHRLHKLIEQANEAGDVDQYITSSDIVFQVFAGVLIKAAISLCTLGHDFDVVVHGYTQLLVSVELPLSPDLIPSTQLHADHLIQSYDGLINHGFLNTTTQIAGEPANVVAGMLGYSDMPLRNNGVPVDDIAAIGTANVVVDLLTGKAFEDPAHKIFNVVSKKVQ